jgi:hypothetical protein
MKIVINANDMTEDEINIVMDTLAMMGVNKVSYESTEFSLKDGKRVYTKESHTPNVVLTPSATQVEAFLKDLQKILTAHTAE